MNLRNFRRWLGQRASTIAAMMLGMAGGAPVLAEPMSEDYHAQESAILSNIRQVTFPSQGLEKAGEAYFAPDEKSIIFQAVPDGETHYQIYTLELEPGARPKRVSTGRGACTCSYFHPDGKSIIFASSHEDPRLDDPSIEVPIPGYKREGSRYQWDFNPYMDIYHANLDGSNLTKLTDSYGYDAEGAYSRDGRTIVFSSNRNGHMNLYRMNADGSDVRQVTDVPNCYNGGPFLSPDGRRIIFRADRDKRDYLQIFMIDIDGGNSQQLTDNGAVNWAPYWLPDSKHIVFTTSLHGHHNYEIYLMNVDTRAMRRVTYHPRFDGLPVISNSGRKMMWTSKRGDDDTSEVFVADFTLPELEN